MTRIAELIGSQKVIAIAPSETVRAAAVLMTESNVGAVPVMESEQLVGMFTERDLMTRVVAQNLDPDNTTVADVMTKEVVSVGPDEDTERCVSRMRSMKCRHLPVIADERLVGIVSLRDVLQSDQRQARAQAALLTDLITNKPEYES